MSLTWGMAFCRKPRWPARAQLMEAVKRFMALINDTRRLRDLDPAVPGPLQPDRAALHLLSRPRRSGTRRSVNAQQVREHLDSMRVEFGRASPLSDLHAPAVLHRALLVLRLQRDHLDEAWSRFRSLIWICSIARRSFTPRHVDTRRPVNAVPLGRRHADLFESLTSSAAFTRWWPNASTSHPMPSSRSRST